MAKLMVCCCAIRGPEARGHLDGEVGLVFAGKHFVGHLVEDCCYSGGVVLADGEDDGLADFAADWIAEGIFKEGLAEDGVGCAGEETFFKLRLLECLFVVFAGVVGEVDEKSLFGEEFGGDFGSGVGDDGIDEERTLLVVYAVDEGEAEGGLAVFAAEGAVGVEEEAAFAFAGVVGGWGGGSEVFEEVAGRGGEAEFVPDEVVKHSAGVSADGTVSFVRYDEVKIGGREESLILVVKEKRLDGADDDLSAAPVVAILFVNDGLEIIFEVGDEIFAGLFFELQAIDEKEDAGGVGGSEEEFDDGGGDERLAGAGGHFEEEAVFAILDGALERVDGVLLVGAEEAEFVGFYVVGAFGFIFPTGIGCVSGALREGDVVGADGFHR